MLSPQSPFSLHEVVDEGGVEEEGGEHEELEEQADEVLRVQMVMLHLEEAVVGAGEAAREAVLVPGARVGGGDGVVVVERDAVGAEGELAHQMCVCGGERRRRGEEASGSGGEGRARRRDGGEGRRRGTEARGGGERE